MAGPIDSVFHDLKGLTADDFLEIRPLAARARRVRVIKRRHLQLPGARALPQPHVLTRQVAGLRVVVRVHERHLAHLAAPEALDLLQK